MESCEKKFVVDPKGDVTMEEFKPEEREKLIRLLASSSGKKVLTLNDKDNVILQELNKEGVVGSFEKKFVVDSEGGVTMEDFTPDEIEKIKERLSSSERKVLTLDELRLKNK
ncbi:MAG: hypothetical protein OEV93_02975 [Candidatus Moranbacteria bacterium]|nr:hypothetical protein [Candidatus Moranbacteria bacterium]